MSVNKPPRFFPSQESVENIRKSWARWLRLLDIYLVAADINDDLQSRALLLNFAGTEVVEIFYNLPNTGTSFNDAVMALSNYFYTQSMIHSSKIKSPDSQHFSSINEFYKGIRISEQKQVQQSKKINPNVKRLNYNKSVDSHRKNANNSQSNDLQDLNVNRPSYKALLNDKINFMLNDELNLKKLDLCNHEGSKIPKSTNLIQDNFIHDYNNSVLDNETDKSKQLDGSKPHTFVNNYEHSSTSQMTSDSFVVENTITKVKTKQNFGNKTCYQCGKSWPHNSQNPCFAIGKVCFKCGQSNHLAKVCKSKKLKLNRLKEKLSQVEDSVNSSNPPSKSNVSANNECPSDRSKDQLIQGSSGFGQKKVTANNEKLSRPLNDIKDERATRKSSNSGSADNITPNQLNQLKSCTSNSTNTSIKQPEQNVKWNRVQRSENTIFTGKFENSHSQSVEKCESIIKERKQTGVNLPGSRYESNQLNSARNLGSSATASYQFSQSNHSSEGGYNPKKETLVNYTKQRDSSFVLVNHRSKSENERMKAENNGKIMGSYTTAEFRSNGRIFTDSCKSSLVQEGIEVKESPKKRCQKTKTKGESSKKDLCCIC